MDRSSITIRDPEHRGWLSGYDQTEQGILAPAEYVADLAARQKKEMFIRAAAAEVELQTKTASANARLRAEFEREDPVGWCEPFKRVRPRHKLLNVADAANLEASGKLSGDRDEKNRLKDLFKAIREKGQYRRLATITPNWRDRLDELEAQFPNFNEVVAYLRRCFAMAEAGDKSIRFAPIALNGPPGTGKSTFAESLARLLNVPWRRINGESMQEGSALTGSSEFWGNTKPGILFEMLIGNDVASPLILFDELDKIGGDHRYDPRGGLYALLEPSTARTYCDLSFPILTLDATRILWVVTSNYFNRVPAPIQSRLRRFDIRPPTAGQGIAIVRNVYANVVREARVRDFGDLPAYVAEAMAEFSPRQMRLALHEALGSALHAGRRAVLPIDVPGLAKPAQAIPPSPNGLPLWPRVTIFLDICGVLHPDTAMDWEELLVRIYAGESLEVKHVPDLEELLQGRKDVGLVLTSHFRRRPTTDELALLMGEKLAKLVVGHVPDIQMPRALQVAAYVATHGIARWIAIDDERVVWPNEMQDRVVTTQHHVGFSTPEVRARLREMLGRFGNQ